MRYVVGLACVLAAAAAHANGRAPETNGIYFKPGDPHSLYVRSTFGLLVSHDDGCTFGWVCEDNVGYKGNFDPKYSIASDGTIFATTFAGLRISHDNACSFTTAATLPSMAWIDALDIGPTGEVWVGTATTGAPNDVFVSTDNGANFVSRGMQSPSIWWKSVRVAKSNAQRVYIAGYQVAGTLPDGGQMPPTAHLFRTDNGGTSWTESPLTGVAVGSTPVLLVAAVDPNNPDIAFVISQGANQPTGDILYRTTDGGQTLTQVMTVAGAFGDIVMTDSNTVYITTLVQSGMALVGDVAYKSTNGGVTFTPIAGAPLLACLGQRSDGTLVGCGANWEPDFMAVASSADGGATWSKVWRFVNLYGPAICTPGTAEEDICAEQQWPTLASQFGVSGPACGALAGQVYGSAGADPPPPPKKKTGCCDAGAGVGPSGLWVAFVAIWLRRKRAR
jgi:hypothetical protein